MFLKTVAKILFLFVVFFVYYSLKYKYEEQKEVAVKTESPRRSPGIAI